MLNTLNIRRSLLIASDILLLYFSLLVAVFFGFGEKFNWPTFIEHLTPFSILYFFWLIIFYIFGLYDLKIVRGRINFYSKILGALSACSGLGMIFFYLIPYFNITPKTNLIFNILIFGFLWLFWRKFFYSIFSSRLLTRVAIIGEQKQTQELTGEISARPYLGYSLVQLESGRDLTSQIQEKKIDVLLIPPNLVFDSELIKNLYQCLPTRVKFLDWARAHEIIAEKIPVSLINHIWFLENLKEGEKALYDNLKRWSDIILAGILLIITVPLWPLIALAIKMEDGGPAFYCQERIGKGKKSFFLFKFRSMEKEAEEKTGPVWAKEADPRITKVGKFLRRSHLDELPQMINVLKGEISLVGPRPERPGFVKQLEREIPHYHVRHLIKPGFTGWAQIKFRYGRTIMDSREKFQYDLYYLKNRSLILDAGILLKTFQLFFKKEQ